MSSGKGQARPAPSARFSVSRTVEAIDALLTEEIRYYCRFALLIVDEIGYRPVTPGGGNLFFELVNARYEKGAMILTSNRGFGEWGDIFGDSVVATALLDRLLHHAVVIQIEGSSYRLRERYFCPKTSASNQMPPPIPFHRPRSVAAGGQRMEAPITHTADRQPARLGNFPVPILGKIAASSTNCRAIC